MHIKCPECAFTREINTKSIPTGSSFATCPKCGIRFRFRADPLVQTQGSNQSELTSSSKQGAEDLPKNASPKNVSSDASPKNTSGEENSKDIWGSMNKMRSEWDEQDQEKKQDSENTKSEAELRAEAQRAYQQAAAQGRVPLHSTVGSVPWEHKGGFLNPIMFFRTIGMAIVRMPQFFGGIDPFSSILPAWLFMMIIRLVELWAIMYGTNILVTMPDGTEQSGSLMYFLQVPMLVIIGSAVAIFSLFQFVGAFIVNYAMRTRMPQLANFRLTFKVLAYAHIPALLSLLPSVGMLFSFVGSIALLVLGIKHAFRLDWKQTIISLAPYFIIGMLMWGISMQISSSML